MHVASVGNGPDTVLFIHCFPELWYLWCHRWCPLRLWATALSRPTSGAMAAPTHRRPQRRTRVFTWWGTWRGCWARWLSCVFVVGHEWGAMIACYLCLFRPDRVKAVVSMSESLRATFGDDYYVCRFQEPGEIEEDFAKADIAKLMKLFLTGRDPSPPIVPKDVGFSGLTKLFENHQVDLPSWLTQDDINYYAAQFSRSGFAGGLNYFRCMDLYVSLSKLMLCSSLGILKMIFL
ncbi:hypothetical protein NL676_002494 [Syzygium grande]|nr:hypothetical protein NL676_002494 [Syzygium grande]